MPSIYLGNATEQFQLNPTKHQSQTSWVSYMNHFSPLLYLGSHSQKDIAIKSFPTISSYMNFRSTSITLSFYVYQITPLYRCTSSLCCICPNHPSHLLSTCPQLMLPLLFFTNDFIAYSIFSYIKK